MPDVSPEVRQLLRNKGANIVYTHTAQAGINLEKLDEVEKERLEKDLGFDFSHMTSNYMGFTVYRFNLKKAEEYVNKYPDEAK